MEGPIRKQLKEMNQIIRSDNSVDKMKFVQFNQSAMMPVHTFGLYAGPYEVIAEDSDNTDVPPMKVYARKSMKDKIKSLFVLGSTSEGMRFFKEYLDCGYHFTKYDTVITPHKSGQTMAGVSAFSEETFDIFKSNDEIKGDIFRALGFQWFGVLLH